MDKFKYIFQVLLEKGMQDDDDMKSESEVCYYHKLSIGIFIKYYTKINIKKPLCFTLQTVLFDLKK